MYQVEMGARNKNEGGEVLEEVAALVRVAKEGLSRMGHLDRGMKEVKE